MSKKTTEGWEKAVIQDAAQAIKNGGILVSIKFITRRGTETKFTSNAKRVKDFIKGLTISDLVTPEPQENKRANKLHAKRVMRKSRKTPR